MASDSSTRSGWFSTTNPFVYLVVLLLAGVGTAGILTLAGDDPPPQKTCQNGDVIPVDEECQTDDDPDDQTCPNGDVIPADEECPIDDDPDQKENASEPTCPNGDSIPADRDALWCGKLSETLTIVLDPLDWFDLDSGDKSRTPDKPGPREEYELLWSSSWLDEPKIEGLRLDNAAVGVGALFAPFRVISDIEEVSLRDLLDARYGAPDHFESGYTDLFWEHPTNTPTEGFVYFVQTNEGNHAVVQVEQYGEADPLYGRTIALRYQTFDLEGLNG